MKSRHCLTAFLLTVFLCAFGAFCNSAWSAVPPSSTEASGQGQLSNAVASTPSEQAAIPGPLRSFLRMAAISQKVSPEEVLPLLARNVFVIG